MDLFKKIFFKGIEIMNKEGHKTYGEDLIAFLHKVEFWIVTHLKNVAKSGKREGKKKEKWKIHEKNELHGKECKTNVFR